MATYADGKTEAMVGDVVKCVKDSDYPPHYDLRRDCTYVVEDDPCTTGLHVTIGGVNYCASRFELIKRTGAAPSPAKAEPLVDLVNHPPHYAGLSPEPVDVIEAWQLEWHEGNAMKYIARAKNKGERIQDLRKAAWYLTRKAEMLEKNSI